MSKALGDAVPRAIIPDLGQGRMAAAMRLAPGRSFPLGATLGSGGANFSVFAKHGEAVELCLFDRVEDGVPARTIELDPSIHRTYHYWHAFVPEVAAGQLYGYRVHGPFAPERGLRFDPDKLLLDPYGRCVALPAGRSRQAAAAPGDNAATAPKSVVVDSLAYDWEGDQPPCRPFAKTVIYEMHVGNFTRHPSSGVAPDLRGTYAGLIEKIPYLQDLGVSAVELLPVFAFDAQDAPPGRVNDWGYQPLSFFAPHPGYSSRRDPLGALDEFRDMVKALHRAGIEVILDVVYNHTCEGGAGGPTICFRGLANDTYYILGTDRATYADYTGMRQHAECERNRRPADDRRQPALLGERDARGRLSLRLGLGPLARRDRLPHDFSADPLGYRVGPGARQREAHCGSMGCGGPVRGRLLRRRQLEGVERMLPRRRARVPQGGQWHGARASLPTDGQPGLICVAGARAGAERQLRHLPRRVHAERPRLLQRQAQRGERRKQPRRRGR